MLIFTSCAHWQVRGDDADDPTTYVVAFGEREARYMVKLYSTFKTLYVV